MCYSIFFQNPCFEAGTLRHVLWPQPHNGCRRWLGGNNSIKLYRRGVKGENKTLILARSLGYSRHGYDNASQLTQASSSGNKVAWRTHQRVSGGGHHRVAQRLHVWFLHPRNDHRRWSVFTGLLYTRFYFNRCQRWSQDENRLGLGLELIPDKARKRVGGERKIADCSPLFRYSLSHSQFRTQPWKLRPYL